ncbi:glycosyltransferase family 4 protein (plasmid) [Singulisphaera sp. Ch08]|uniref:Glycosyltransferase family 4 protein n=1 Tax=Singulisphaera sp. Ch08 TaxID=3120278 RepID=A0AAU7CU68_9BACT
MVRVNPKSFLLVSGDFVKTGGMDRANYALAAHLADKGHDVHLVAYRAGDELVRQPNLKLHRVRKPLGSYLLGHPVMGRAGRALAKRIGEAGGRVVVNGGNCRWGDVNWLHHLNVLDLPNASGSLGRRFHRRLSYWLFSRADRAALKMARIVVTTCERNKQDLVNWLGINPDRVRVVYYGTDPEVFRPAAEGEREALRTKFGWPLDRPLLAFVGALGDRRKGFDTLFHAWEILCRDSRWQADLVVAGTGAELDAWKERAETAGIASRIRFLGFRRDVPDIFRACDAHVLPSRYEGYSLVTQEALCCGRPAFITRTAGIAERFPAELQDLLIPDPDNAVDLADRLRHWFANSDQFARPLASFSEQLRSSTWDQMAERFLAIVEEAG